MSVTRNQASSTNGGDEDAFQRLLHTVPSLQARSDEQSRQSEEAERRFRMAEERHLEALRRAQERAEELQQQLEAIKGARRENLVQQETPLSFWGQPFNQEIDDTRVPPNFREIVVEPFDGSQDPQTHLQAFQAQMYISGGDDRLSCKLFPGTLRGVAMQWMATLPPRTIQTFNDLAEVFTSQFAASKKKQLEVADLFDVKQGREESLKSYLARFNTATVRVNDPDQKFFIKAFQKGLRASPFSDSLALKRPSSMAEIRTRAEKHIEVEEDQAERLAEEQNRKNEGRATIPKAETSRRMETTHKEKHFTPLNEKRAQILREICHTRLLRFPPSSEGRTMGNNQSEWCEFHRTMGHSTEACWTLKTQIERLVQGGRLNQYVNTQRQWAQGEGSQDRRRSRLRPNSRLPTKGRRSTNIPLIVRPTERYGPSCVNRGQCNSVGKTDDVTNHRLYKRRLQKAGQGKRRAHGHIGYSKTIQGRKSIGGSGKLGQHPVLASYNIIIGRPALNRLEAVVSTFHLCMKFPVGRTVATVWADITAARKCYEDSMRIELAAQKDKVNVLDIDLDPRHFLEDRGPHPVGNLKKVQIGIVQTIETYSLFMEEAVILNVFDRCLKTWGDIWHASKLLIDPSDKKVLTKVGIDFLLECVCCGLSSFHCYGDVSLLFILGFLLHRCMQVPDSILQC
ncbi:hypothetical protein CR513_57398, partial [Mucuna pruriens]